MTLAALGWSAFFADAFEPYNRDGLVPARVAVKHHGPCVLLTESGELGGIPSGRLDESELPAVGDWVVARPLPGERKAVIEAVLPRRTSFSRKESWRRTAEQVIAANVDAVFLVTDFGGDLNPRRLERYLAAAWESGAEPVIVVNKADLAVEREAAVAEIEAIAFGVPIEQVSALAGEGLDALRAYVGPGRTAALLGSSGVGKSTLANALCGSPKLETGGLRADGRGRHTTVRRELVELPEGGFLLDTPGMRELQLWASEEALGGVFEEIEALASQCRFNDCAHRHEPGCAVLAALAAGSLDPGRLESYRKLQRELRALAIRQDRRLQLEERKKWRRIERSRRKVRY